MNMKNVLPFANGFHSRYQKSKDPEGKESFDTLWLLPACVFFLYPMEMLSQNVSFPLTRVY